MVVNRTDTSMPVELWEQLPPAAVVTEIVVHKDRHWEHWTARYDLPDKRAVGSIFGGPVEYIPIFREGVAARVTIPAR